MPRVSIDRYRQLGPCPAVGVGACVRAVDLRRGERPVVLKFLPPIGEDDGALDAVAASLEPLRHSAIVPVQAHGLDGERPFFVLDPPEGQSLRALLEGHRDALRWPALDEVRAIVDGVCAAVGVAHRMRAVAGEPVLHGLLSPESVWLSRSNASAPWDVAVMDFALASLPGVTWVADATSLLGDPRPPEQLADPAARSCAGDVFALGVLLATALVPYTMPARPQCWAHFVERAEGDVRATLQSMRPDLPTPLCDEIARALAASPDDRHADADRLRTALRRVTWEPAAELKAPPRALAPAVAPAPSPGTSPLIRLPSALMADAAPQPMSARRASAPSPAPEPVGEETSPERARPFDAMSDAPSTIPSTSAIDALRAMRRALRAQQPAPDPTEFVAAPAGDLFAGSDWAASATLRESPMSTSVDAPAVTELAAETEVSPSPSAPRAQASSPGTVPMGSLHALIPGETASIERWSRKELTDDPDETHVAPRPPEVVRTMQPVALAAKLAPLMPAAPRSSPPTPSPLLASPPSPPLASPPSPWRDDAAPVMGVTTHSGVTAKSPPHPGHAAPTPPSGALHSPVVLAAIIAALALIASAMLWVLLRG